MRTTRDGLYCEHGVRTGGLGWDRMCGWCETGASQDEYELAMAAQDLHVLVKQVVLPEMVAGVPVGVPTGFLAQITGVVVSLSRFC